MSTARAARNTLTRQKVLDEALELADREGLAAFTIRELATRLGVRPMSIYHYTPSKEELLDALVDVVFSEVHLPCPTGEWRTELRQRSVSMRDALARHRWALPVMETRAHPGPATLANHEAVLAVLRASGFSLQAAAHAYAILDAFVYGFSLQEAMLDTVGMTDTPDEVAAAMDLGQFPRVAELAVAHSTAALEPFGASFDVGLEATLDGIARLADVY
ncbi:TetR/AcrR family transcriptional regulator C-terminal domain-containing protein [Aestuariimicrobium sp. Y1814]|uniref:TetR/AcrR family transcriptional regulator C-terminal domain-containing protein n=1 Tax=Aestuariimicrobium sp. Y1814 TaxID=3418742 RepID=UPI003DA75F9F